MTLTPGKLDQVPDGEAEGAGPSVLELLSSTTVGTK